MAYNVGKKTCTKCKEEKQITCFASDKNTPDGLTYQCRDCKRAYDRKNRHRFFNRKRQASRVWRKNHPEQSLANTQAQRAKNPDAYKAHGKVSTAKRDGKLSVPASCETCGQADKLEGHHYNYDKPLKVTWLCVKCHNAVHLKG